LGEPERDEVDAFGEQRRAAVDEFAKLGHGLDEMRVDKLKDPLRRLLPKLRLQFDLQYAVPGTLIVSGTAPMLNVRQLT
jgi:hypothetical protein